VETGFRNWKKILRFDDSLRNKIKKYSKQNRDLRVCLVSSQRAKFKHAFSGQTYQFNCLNNASFADHQTQKSLFKSKTRLIPVSVFAKYQLHGTILCDPSSSLWLRFPFRRGLIFHCPAVLW
jgi:hypothetical protein